MEKINPNSKVIKKDCFIEPAINNSRIENKFQFFRHGYFNVDKNSSAEKLIFNRIVALKNSWKRK